MHQRRLFSTAKQRCRSILIYGDSNTWGYNPNYCQSADKATQRFEYRDRWTTICQNHLGSQYQIIPEGLNSRTTIFSSLESDGEYCANGRATLPVILHTHKPLHGVIIALGTNDLKRKFTTKTHDVVSGIKTLVKDVTKQTNIGHSSLDNVGTDACSLIIPPKILILGPPFLVPNALNRLWGIEESASKESRKLSALLTLVCKELKVDYLALGNIAKVSELDGIHYPVTEQPVIGAAVAKKLQEMFET